MKTERRKVKQRRKGEAAIVLSPTTLMNILSGSCFLHKDLPEDARIVRVFPDVMRNSIVAVVESEEFDNVPEGESIPFLGCRTVELMPCVKVRLGLHPEDARGQGRNA